MSERFRFTNIDSFREQVRKKFQAQVIPIVLAEAANNSIEPLKQEVIEAFKRTEVYQIMSSDDAAGINKDINALMGLSDSYADMALADMEDAVINSLEIDFAGYNFVSERTIIIPDSKNSRINKIGFRIRFVALRDALLSSPSASYVSDKSQEDIPWLSWLINGGDVDATLLYDYYESSRSGRAIMTEDGGSWSFDPGDVAIRGNFLKDITSDPELIKNGRLILKSQIESAMDNVSKRKLVIE